MLTAVLILGTGLISGCNTLPNVPGNTAASIAFQDDFKDPKSGWFVYKADPNKGGSYENGGYKVWTTARDTVIALNPKTRQEIGDFTVEANVQRLSEGYGTAMGFIYRLTADGRYYRFAVTDNQTYWVGRRTNLLEEQIVDETYSSYIKPSSEVNRLKVVCKGAQQEVYVNGNLLTSVTDNVSLKGELGMAFSNYGKPAASYIFSDFKLWGN
jgi:hypothetical protein